MKKTITLLFGRNPKSSLLLTILLLLFFEHTHAQISILNIGSQVPIITGFSTFAQTTRRCNNNSGITGVNVYATIQAAHDAAVAGDIIYVESSLTSYGNLTCSKSLTMIGNGYFLDQNTNVSFDTRNSNLGNVIFLAGSANSFLKGMLTQTVDLNNVSNITINRCKTNTIRFNFNISASAPSSNHTISQCLIGSSLFGSNSTTTNGGGKNCIITNNIVAGGGISDFENSVIQNNTIMSPGSTGGSGFNGCTVTNNIVSSGTTGGSSTALITGGGNNISNNIMLGNTYTFPAGSGNINNANLATTFLVANPNSSNPDKDFQLAVGSPAIGIGTGGTNTGAFFGGGKSLYFVGFTGLSNHDKLHFNGYG